MKKDQVLTLTPAAAKRHMVLTMAYKLMKATNQVTTLEIKNELRITQPDFFWTQAVVSEIMDEYYAEGRFVFADTGTFRIYSDPARIVETKKRKIKNAVADTIKAKTISRIKALELMKANKGIFFTAVFDKKDGAERKMNCQYMKDQEDSVLGYVKVREAIKLKKDPEACVRNINLQTLKSLTIAGRIFKVK